MFLSLWPGALTTVVSLLVACTGIWSLLRNPSLPSSWMIFFCICWDVQGNDWSSRSDISIKFLTLLKSTYWFCWFVLWLEPPSWTMSFGTKFIVHSVVSGVGCVSKFGGFCANFLGYIMRVCCNCKIWFGVNSNSYSLSDSSLELVVTLGSSALCYLIFLSGDILFFIGEMVGTKSMVSNRWATDINILRWRTLVLFGYDLDLISKVTSFLYHKTTSAISGFQYGLRFPGPPFGVKFLTNTLSPCSNL